MTLYVRTEQGHQYHILDTGDIRRLDLYPTGTEFKPSGKWKMLGLTHVKERRNITLSQLRCAYGDSEVMPTPRPKLVDKKGNPQWRVIDLDHGTTRVWGDSVVDIRKL